jgi:cytochrome c-type biogenesis protein
VSFPLADAGLSGTVYNGSFLAAAAVAALVGLIGFLSPCVLPLVPGYLSYVAGLAGSQNRPRARRMLAGALLFVLGFTVVYVLAVGLIGGAIGQALNDHIVGIERVLGAVTILFGLAFLGRFPFLQRDYRIHALPPAGLLGAPLLGVVFGLTWGPCQTPTLTAVTALATEQGTAWRGALLMTAYCLGLGIPFLLIAAGFGWVTGAVGFVRRHAGVISRISGLLLIGIGVLLVTGTWDHWMEQLRTEFATHPGLGGNL